MSGPLVEALPAARLRDGIARRVAARLTEGGSDATGEPDPATRAAVDAAVDDLLGSGRLFVVRERDGVLPEIVTALIERLPEVVARRRQALSERHIEALVDVYLGADPLAAAMTAIESDNAAAQAAFLKRWPVLTAEGVAERAAHTSSNRSATAGRWKKARKVFSLRAAGREVYPDFQFEDGRPRPVIAGVLAALPESLTGWQTAFWFVGSNGWLDGAAPVDRLDDGPALAVAAKHRGDAWTG